MYFLSCARRLGGRARRRRRAARRGAVGKARGGAAPCRRRRRRCTEDCAVVGATPQGCALLPLRAHRLRMPVPLYIHGQGGQNKGGRREQTSGGARSRFTQVARLPSPPPFPPDSPRLSLQKGKKMKFTRVTWRCSSQRLPM